MKVQVAKIDSQASGFVNNTQFGIGDAAMVMEVLRNQLYNDPLFSSVREYLCNARDANREAGNAAPISVILPTYNNLFLTISDGGPGISPDRMSNIFTQFGMSTKRHTNELTGGFGLGGKSGFAYSDTFSIISVVDGMMRTYTAYIDSSRLGAMTLLKEEITDKSNGTSIILPIKKEDLERCKVIIRAITYFWSCKPTFYHSTYNANGEMITQPFNINYAEPEQVLYEGDEWYCVKENKANRLTNYGNSNKLYILIDEIPYDIDVGKFDHSLQSKMNALHSNNFRIKFNNSELSLAASRDSITYDPKTIKAITAKYEVIAKDISGKINEAVEQNKSYLDALIHLLEIKGSLSSFKHDTSLLWNNRELYPHNIVSYQFWGNHVEFYHLYSYFRKTSTTSIYLYDFLKTCKDSPQKIFILDSDKQSIVSYAKNLCNKFNLPDVWLVRINHDSLNNIKDPSLKEDCLKKANLITEFVTNKLSEVVFDKQVKARTSFTKKSLSNKENILVYDFAKMNSSSSKTSSLEEVPLEGNCAYVIYDYDIKGSFDSKIRFSSTNERLTSHLFDYGVNKYINHLGIDKIYAITPGKKNKVLTSDWQPLENVIKNQQEALLKVRPIEDWFEIWLELKFIQNILSLYNNDSLMSYISSFLRKKLLPSQNSTFKASTIPYIDKINDFYTLNLLNNKNHNFVKFVERAQEVLSLEKDLEKVNFLFKTQISQLAVTCETLTQSVTKLEDLSKLNGFNKFADNAIIHFLSFVEKNACLFKNISDDDHVLFRGYYDPVSKLSNKIYYNLPSDSLEFLGYIK